MNGICFVSFAIGLIGGLLVTALASLCLDASDYYHYKAIEKKRKIYLNKKGGKHD